MFSSLAQDARFAVRSLGKSPLLTGVAVLSLALGIGANTAIFTLFDQVLLRTLPVEEPESLVMFKTEGSHYGSNRGPNMQSYPMFRDYRERNDVMTGVFCRRGEVVNLGYGASTERAEAELVSGNYFEVLGVPAALGRVFSMDDETALGGNPVVVLNHRFWRERFSANPAILGQAVRINGHPMTVVGVAAAGFDGITPGYRPQIHVPVTMKREVTPSWDDFDDRRTRWVQVFGRLKQRGSRETAEAQIRTLHKQMIAMESEEPYFAEVSPYAKEQFLKSYAVLLPAAQGFSHLRRALETPLRVLMVFVGLVLLITCANVSNLLVAKATSRRKEIAMRLAIGAGRRRILQQLLVESVLLAVMGGVFGLFVGYLTSHGLIALAPSEQQRLALDATPDTRVLAFTVAVSLATAIGFGLVPALQAARTDLLTTMKESSSAAGAGRGTRLRKGLVVVQVTVALMLLLGAGLFVQSLRNLDALDPGFHATNLVRFKLDPMLGGYDVAETKQFYARLRERLDQLPGVESTGLAVVAIMEGNEWDSTVTVEGYRSEDGENMNPHFNAVSPEYFETLGLAIRAGRDFGPQDVDGAKQVVIVNETFAKRYFDDQSPVGYHLAFGGGPNVVPDMEIIGVVEDAKYENLRDEVPRQVFVTHQQTDWATGMTAYVRTSVSSEAVFESIRGEVQNLDAAMPIFDMNTMEDQLDRSLSVERLTAFLSSAFGVLAAILAFVGLYGVTAYSVTRRSPELGLRMALGATGGKVTTMVLKEVLWLTAIGVAVALPCVWFLARLVESELYGVAPRDPVATLLATATLAALTLLAGALPALRASRLDPVSVLRYQ